MDSELSMAEFSADKACRILSLDGGGAEGFYTLGVLKGIEGMLGVAKLSDRFDLVRNSGITFPSPTQHPLVSMLRVGRARALQFGGKAALLLRP
jgi:hypothetical protein